MQRRTLLLAPLPMALAACSGGGDRATGASTTSTTPGSGGLAGLGLADAPAQTVIEKLDALDQARPLDFKASVTATELVVTDSAGEHRLELPADRFYLSVAPYVTTTHECFNHSLSGCQGEQIATTVHLKAVSDSGAVLLDEDRTTGRNGFVGIWLPSGEAGKLTVTLGERSGTVPFATGSDDPTCLTTLKLA